ncbi:MAG: hypothetical protein ACLFM7_09215 [Bacteroidales bacterium]
MDKDKNYIFKGMEEMTLNESVNTNGGLNIFKKFTKAIGFIWGELNDGHYCDAYGARVYEE